MTDKIQVAKDKIMARDKTWVTYMDEGGTLRKARASQVQVEGEQISAAPEPEPVKPVVATQEAPPTLPSVPPEAPPSSGMSPAPPEATNPKPSKPKGKKTTMATAQSTAAKKTAKPPVKVAAKKSVAKRSTGNGEHTGIRTIGGKAVNLDNYEKVKTPAGGTSYHNGDQVAEKLAGKTLDEVYTFAAKVLKEEEKVLRNKYKHLNVGMQRMSLGNRCRKVIMPKEAKN